MEDTTSALSPQLRSALEQLQALTRHLGELQRDSGLAEIDPEDYLTTSVRPSLVQVRSPRGMCAPDTWL